MKDVNGDSAYATEKFAFSNSGLRVGFFNRSSSCVRNVVDAKLLPEFGFTPTVAAPALM